MGKEESKCPICGNKNIIFLQKLSAYHYCGLCQVAWLKKIPKVSYNQNYYQGKNSLASILFQPITLFFYTLRQRYANGGKKQLWIDVGAGSGEFLKTVKAKRKIGVEISEAGRKMMTNYGLETMTDKQFLKNKSLNVDIISFWHVLEHMEKPWEYIHSAGKNLKRGGEIIIGLPNIASWEFKFFGKYWFHLVPEYHIWHFSPKSVILMLKNNGFKINSIDYVSFEHHPTGLLQSLINKSSRTHNILHKLVKRETDLTSFPLRGIFWVIFWLSLGLPLVLVIWLTASVFRKSGTFVITAKLQ